MTLVTEMVPRGKDSARMEIICGDCLEVMRGIEANSVDAIVTDPPYGLKFMGKSWDHGLPGEPFWAEALRIAKPGCHLLAFGGTRTFHRLTCAIEDAGWEIRDCLGWIYGSGFPKSLDVSKAIDKAAGAERDRIGHNPNHRPNQLCGQAEFRPCTADRAITAPATDAARQWQGWGTALKPAWEPIILARKPLDGTVAANVQKWGTGAVNVDGCRVPTSDCLNGGTFGGIFGNGRPTIDKPIGMGRWPANIIHDGSDEVLELFPQVKAGVAVRRNIGHSAKGQIPFATGSRDADMRDDVTYGDSGSAARFFYCAKASRREREMGLEGAIGKTQAERTGRKEYSPGLVMPGRVNNPYAGNSGVQIQRNHHPTVKPLDLMRYLCRLVTPPNGLVIDPFCGSGSTGIAATQEGFRFIGIDNNEEYCEIARKRLENA